MQPIQRCYSCYPLPPFLLSVTCRRVCRNVLRYFDRGAGRVAFFAARDIGAGEELLLDYGSNYWRGREQMELP